MQFSTRFSTKKHVLAATATAVIAVLVAGCSSASSTAAGSTTSSAGAAPSAPSSAAAAPAAGASVAASSAPVAASSAPAASSSGSPSAASTGGTFAQDSSTLIFGAVPDKAGSDSNWKPLEEYIAKKTGLTVVYKPTTDYSALIAASVAGQVDIGAFSGLTYVQATNQGAKIDVASAVISSPGLTTPGYYSDPIVPKGSSITSVKGFKGKKVCFVDPASTSGFLFPLLALKTAGINVTPSGKDASGNPTFADFTAFFAGAHDKSVQAVGAKQCEAGFAEDTEAEDTPALSDKVTVVKDGRQLVPGGPLVYADALPSDLKTKLHNILSGASLDAITAAGITVTAGFKSGYYGVAPETKAFYQKIYNICTDIPAADCAPKS